MLDSNKNKITVSELLNAVSETEYPEYILNTIEKIREWIKDSVNTPDDLEEQDPLTAMFEHNFENEYGNFPGLFSRLRGVEEYADVLPNIRPPEGKSDVIIISIVPPDYESGIRAAIDYAAVFNHKNCKRVWIIGNSFIFDEIMRYSHHVDALARQGIILRYILVTPWGWVELPLSGAMASKSQFLWRPVSNNKTRKRSTKTRGNLGE